uniref:Uncharacterized protein n=1 Tax=viral metagenome TaxID=1070528 RepID=A0A6M3IVG9_9ZZZZ
MGYVEELMKQGYVPEGQTPKTILPEGGDPGNYDTGPMANVARALEKMRFKFQQDQETKIKKIEKKSDMYKTLREAGYEPKRAFDAVSKLEFPTEMPGETPAEKEKKIDLQQKELNLKRTGKEIEKTGMEIEKIQSEINTPNRTRLTARVLNKIANEEMLTPGEQKLYDETIKHKTGSDLDSILNDTTTDEGTNLARTKERILAKIADDEKLTVGEQKIYDEVIAKSPAWSRSIKSGAEKMIPVITADGRRGFVPESKLKAFLASGGKRR